MGSSLEEDDFLQVAEALRLQGRYGEAIETCQRVLKKKPELLFGRLFLGRCLLESGNIMEARKELENVAAKLEECLPVYRILSQVYLQEKEMDKALEALRRWLYFPPSAEMAQKEATPLEMGMLYRGTPPFATSRIPPPGQESRGAEEKRAKAAIQTDTLAEIYIRQGRLEKALSVYQEILVREPDNKGVREKFENLKVRMEREYQVAARKKVLRRLEQWLDAVS